MSRFVTKLAIEQAEDQDGDQWILLAALIFESEVAKRTFIVPRGTRTDLASTPRLPLVYALMGNVAHAASVLHDYLYQSGQVPRALADAVMREAAGATGVSWWQRWSMWVGVRAFGSRHYMPDDPDI